ncbi:MAG: hypothetical protein CEE43_15485 [Promethearchaeota archaeon Loki_b32]|nr:MAG: hypothetical protein CEE43_15485 [Candidatus Lokiarchaeota archaeon Loki_b32]
MSISQFITDDFQGTLSKQDYLITTKTITIEQLKNLGITKIFDAHGRELSLSGVLKGSYRILTSEDRKYRALIEVTGKNIRAPEGWVDGIGIAGTWIRSALLTNKEGNLLSSSFFNPYNPTSFKIKNYNWLEVEFLQSLSDVNKDYLYYDENGKPYGVNLFTVFSLTDGDSNLNLEMLVSFINPVFRTDYLKFEFSQIKPYFENLIINQDSKRDELVTVYQGSPPPPEFKDRDIIESECKAELDALSLLFYHIREYLMDQKIRDLPINFLYEWLK